MKEREDFLEKTEDNDRVDKRWQNSSGIIKGYIGREIIETYWNVNTISLQSPRIMEDRNNRNILECK